MFFLCFPSTHHCLQSFTGSCVYSCFFERRKRAFSSRFYQCFKRKMLLNAANRVNRRLQLKIFF
ncbi:unnamed protein product [Staurois parvus]|uniref:Secreted protein n=1 Tax=Staurois parvus TaxID=386267 RepID=A0ABN9DBK1_9NEOB|nr:unnamed protein product [Staurois parvus]